MCLIEIYPIMNSLDCLEISITVCRTGTKASLNLKIVLCWKDSFYWRSKLKTQTL